MFLFYFLYRHMFFVYAMTVLSHFFDYQTFSYIIDPVKSDTDVLEHIHIHLPVFNSIYCFSFFSLSITPIPTFSAFAKLWQTSLTGEGVVCQAFPPWGLSAKAPSIRGAGRETGKGVFYSDTNY